MGCPGPLALTGWLGTIDRGAHLQVNQHVSLVYLIQVNNQQLPLTKVRTLSCFEHPSMMINLSMSHRDVTEADNPVVGG